MNDSRIFPRKVMYGHAYVPNQTLNTVFNNCEALQNGTLFPELVSYYRPGLSEEINEYLRMDKGGYCNE